MVQLSRMQMIHTQTQRNKVSPGNLRKCAQSYYDLNIYLSDQESCPSIQAVPKSNLSLTIK